MDKRIEVLDTSIEGLQVLKPLAVSDDRGSFFRFYCKNELSDALGLADVVQANQSTTKKKGTLRGLHFQTPPSSEDKLIRCIQGEIFDVAVDLRKGSKTFLKWHGQILSRENNLMMLIPKGFAHGFQALDQNCEVLYLHTNYYNPKNESGLKFDDPKIAVDWPLSVQEVSPRDKSFPLIDASFKGVEL